MPASAFAIAHKIANALQINCGVHEKHVRGEHEDTIREGAILTFKMSSFIARNANEYLAIDKGKNRVISLQNIHYTCTILESRNEMRKGTKRKS